MKRNSFIFIFLLSAFVGGATVQSGTIGTPYGVCAHVSRWEYDRAAEEFQLMKAAGIDFVRSDLDWSSVEPAPGQWEFSRWDRLVREAGKHRITLVPILGYHSPWASPAFRHLPQWLNYVETVVRRYGKEMPYMEIWNEPNLQQFWNEMPDGAAYAAFLKSTFARIRQAAPEVRVMYAGLSEFAFPYIEKSFQAGAAEAFDVFCLHPYRWNDVPETTLAGDTAALQRMIRQYRRRNAPVWFTETGYSTAVPGTFFRELATAVMKGLRLPPTETVLLAVEDRHFSYFSESPSFRFADYFPEVRAIRRLPLDRLPQVDDPGRTLLVLPENESFPAARKDQLLAYLKRGGNVFFTGGLPFYFDWNRRSDGTIEKKQINDALIREFHIGYETFWTRPGVPDHTETVENAPGFESIRQRPDSGVAALRFLNTDHLKGNDRFIPVLYGRTGSYRGALAAIYEYDSELKGKAAVNGLLGQFELVSEEQQAELLPRTCLISLAAGVEKFFWYSFRSTEAASGRESHFGIVRRDLTPKPAYHAYATLIRHLPNHSARPRISARGDLHLASWRKPDGTPVHAIWTARAKQAVTLKLSGTPSAAADYLGRSLDLFPENGLLHLTASPRLQYLEGVETVSILH